jgi:hypothetical protein
VVACIAYPSRGCQQRHDAILLDPDYCEDDATEVMRRPIGLSGHNIPALPEQRNSRYDRALGRRS